MKMEKSLEVDDDHASVGLARSWILFASIRVIRGATEWLRLRAGPDGSIERLCTISVRFGAAARRRL
jgi:hypothetical protein